MTMVGAASSDEEVVALLLTRCAGLLGTNASPTERRVAAIAKDDRRTMFLVRVFAVVVVASVCFFMIGAGRWEMKIEHPHAPRHLSY